MPGYDGRGPMGAGPMTGGGRGLCGPSGRGYDYGRGAGLRRGGRGVYGYGGGMGFGRRQGFVGNPPAYDNGVSLNSLKAEADYLKDRFENINKQILEMENSTDGTR